MERMVYSVLDVYNLKNIVLYLGNEIKKNTHTRFRTVQHITIQYHTKSTWYVCGLAWLDVCHTMFGTYRYSTYTHEWMM